MKLIFSICETSARDLRGMKLRVWWNQLMQLLSREIFWKFREELDWRWKRIQISQPSNSNQFWRFSRRISKKENSSRIIHEMLSIVLGGSRQRQIIGKSVRRWKKNGKSRQKMNLVSLNISWMSMRVSTHFRILRYDLMLSLIKLAFFLLSFRFGDFSPFAS